MEDNLARHILQMEKMLFGLLKATVQEVAFQMAIKYDTTRSHLFNADKKIAGCTLFRKFLVRNPQHSRVRNPEPMRITRAAGFNKPAVCRVYDILEATIEKYKFDSTRIFSRLPKGGGGDSTRIFSRLPKGISDCSQNTIEKSNTNSVMCPVCPVLNPALLLNRQ